MNPQTLRERDLLKIDDPLEFFKKADELLQYRLHRAEVLYAENKVVVQEKGQWTLNLGTNLTFDEAFGPASPEEIAANKKKPLSQILGV